MKKPVIESLLQAHLTMMRNGMVVKGLHDCHAEGLESIMLHDIPGNRIRMFVARENHTLWQNERRINLQFSLGIHAHHCDVRLIGAHGPVYNDLYGLVPHPRGDFQKFAYRSEITSGQSGTIEPTGEFAYAKRFDRCALQDSYSDMPAHMLHTIYIPKQHAAAWLVVEGEEDPDYNSVFWSNNKAPSIGPHFYTPMTQQNVYAAIESVVTHYEITGDAP